MSHLRIAYCLLLGVTMALYLAMVLWSLPMIAAAAGGLVPFDLRPGGYSETQAREFLLLLTEDGREFYLNVQHKLDFAYPGLMALTLGIGLYWLFQNAPGWVRNTLVLLPSIGSCFDYLENSRVSQMLRQAAEMISVDQISATSHATILKSGFMTAAMLAVVVGLVLAWLQRRRAP